MKSFFEQFRHIHLVSAVTGVIAGVLITLIAVSLSGDGLTKSKDTFASKSTDTHAESQHSDEHMNHNPYMMSPVTSEKQFLEDMILHHEAAVVMAQQVLTIKNIHPEVTKLANAIIGAQSSEIKMMKDWLWSWKF